MKTALFAAAALATLTASTLPASPAIAQDPLPDPAPVTDRLPEDEIIYFLLPDRFANGDPSNDTGGIEGGRLDHGFDPTHTGFYHGGDLAGLIDRLDYIEGLGVTAIWLTPVFENKPVQGPDGNESAGYHGYWITDFLNVDPHLGTREDFAALVDAAHERGMKVYMDIITNHTADVIQYRECHDPDFDGERVESCDYRSLADHPWTTRGGVDGEAINDGFLGEDPRHQTEDNFARLENPDWAYTPFVPESEEGIKNPAWLNDLTVYHNRGETTFEGENSLYGDFAGLDDVFTGHPRAIEGMIEIYKSWITDFGVDGFRIDTARHVKPEFWQAFIPAIREHAEAEGIENFYIFGEVYEFDAGRLASHTHDSELPTVLDFAFQGAIRGMVAEGEPAITLEQLFQADSVYAGGRDTAGRLPTFLGNHDMGRFAGFIRQANPDMDEDEQIARVALGHAMMMYSRGAPTLYYGDEQGFAAEGGDQAAREPLFESEVDQYNAVDLLGTDASTADANYDTDHPLYRAIADMAGIRSAHPALRRGEQIVRHADLDGGVLALSRIREDTGEEYLVVFNAEDEPRDLNVTVDGAARRWESVTGECAPEAEAAASYPVSVPALGHVICRSVWDD